MATIINVRPAGLDVTLSGDFTLDEAKRTFREVVEHIGEHQVEKVLLDGRNTTGDPTVIERFFYGQYVADAVQQLKDSGHFDMDPQFAYVMHEPLADPGRFGETVAVNRGMNVKVHETVEDALRWLGVKAEDMLG